MTKKTRESKIGPKLAGLIVLLISLVSVQATEKCLLDRPEVNPKKFFHFEGQSLTITLETSNRISHQLTSHVFKIFLQEIIGYSKVAVYENNGDNFEDRLDRISGHDSQQRWPETMINVEVLVPPNEDIVKRLDVRYVRDCGNLILPGRFGWFIPKELEAPIRGLTETEREVHWIKFRDARFRSAFHMSQDDMDFVMQHAFMDVASKRYFCEKGCEDGVFTSDLCKNDTKAPCAVLLAPYYNDTSFVIDQIKELKIHVRVVWLGGNLRKVATELTARYLRAKKNKSLVLLSWTPSEVVLDDNDYMSVFFPRCTPNSANCMYEQSRLAKFSWSKLAQPANNALHKFKFDLAQYRGLLKMYVDNPSASVASIACDWMRSNQKVWNTWKKEYKNKLYIGGIFPISNSAYGGKGIAKAAWLAASAVTLNESILPGYEIEVLITDGQCRADRVMRAFIDFIVEDYYPQLIGVLGPACSDTIEPLVGVSKYYDTVVISYSAEGSSFSDREENYPYFFRTIGENKQFKHVYLKLFQKFGWQRVAALTEDGQKYTEYISHMQQFLGQNNVTLISNTKYPRERKLAVMRMYLDDLKRKRARIIIADVFDVVVRNVMCEASKLEMTADQGYVWFLPSWLEENFYDTDYYNQKLNENVSCTTAEMKRAINGYFALSHAFYAPDDAIMQENITVGKWRKKYNEYSKKVGGPSDYGGFAYDAVWTFALAFDKLLKNDSEAHSKIHSNATVRKFVNLIQETDFHGVSGRIKFYGGPSRVTNINIIQWYNNRKHLVGQFIPDVNEETGQIIDGTLNFRNHSEIKWFTPGSVLPDDGTVECALKGFADFLNVECEMGIIVLNLIVTLVLVIILFSVVYVIKKQYDKKVRLTEQYMKSFGINLTEANLSDLDKWEIPRESVVINRKLGEGAFGTVYGGEANFSDIGWKAIAVKTLKVGSTTEEKLDFLSEAEMMKRFDHPNIVRLLGVCTKNEPVYTIMEFMLYGDLKTFLLARRHLVCEKSEECEEISSKKLTAMALDVARGLSYLANLKYVHRDVACRNCLVNANRVVKLGDFGMTRSMFENDYYRFNRKGMLPVRWMSPESLELGIFTPSSDVWSYAVLLYEIITFGSFPFQGFSNTQVLEYVKKGNTLNIPHGVRPQLEGLLKSCWSKDPKSRPSAREIVEFLANNPRLLFPCLDVPLSSVQIEDTSQLEMHLPNKFRKCSSVSLKMLDSPKMPNGISSPTKKKSDDADCSLEQPLLENLENVGVGREGEVIFVGAAEEVVIGMPNGHVQSKF